MASIEIVLNPNPINIDVVQLPQTNIDIVYSSGGAVDSVNGQTGTVLINAVPDGGTTGQVLAKSSNDDNDTEWINQQSSHPFLSLLGNYKIDTSDTTPPAGSGDIKYSNATQVNSTNLYVSAITDGGMDVEVLISLLNVGTVLLIQDENDAVNYQKWQISSVPTFEISSDSYTIPVTLLTSAGTGTSNFANNHKVFLSAFLSAANPVWGGITGTLSSQTDLQSALDAKQNSLGFTPEDVSNKDIDGTLTANSDTKYPSQKAVKTYADTKRGLTPRVTSTTTATTLTINCDTTDEAVLTALASALTIANPTGTALDGQKLFIAIKDNGTIRAITLGANIIDVFGQVPASTTASKWVYIGLRYNTSAAAWHVLAANTQA